MFIKKKNYEIKLLFWTNIMYNSDNLKYFSIVRDFKIKIFLFLIILFDKNKIRILIYHYYIKYIRYYLFKKMVFKNLHLFLASTYYFSFESLKWNTSSIIPISLIDRRWSKGAKGTRAKGEQWQPWGWWYGTASIRGMKNSASHYIFQKHM